MAFIGWVATHTGLPSLYATGTGRLTAVTGVGRERLITNVSGAALVSDAGAAPGVETRYSFGGATLSLQRVGDADGSLPDPTDWITTADGTVVANIQVLGDDERAHETDAEVFTSALGRQIPRYRLGQSPATGTVEVATVGEGTLLLRELVAARQPLWLLHNAVACQLRGCDVEGARLIVPQRLVEVRSARRDVAQRNWEIFYTRVPDDLVGARVERTDGVPVVTWGQWEAWGETNRPSGWQNWSEVQVAQRVAGMPAV